MFAEGAARLDFEVVLATDRCHVLDNPWGDHAIPIRFDAPEQAVAAVAEHLPIDGIVALGDRPAWAAAHLGLPYNSITSVTACGNKHLARKCFKQAGLLVPDFFIAAPGSRFEATYPCVLKPLGLSASRGVIRANTPAEFATAFERIQAIQKGAIQVERFIPGREFALEGLVTDGRLTVLALFDKPDPLDGPFFEETIYVTPSREAAATQQAIFETTARAVRALGLTQGPVHAEMRVNPEGVWMLEVAARPIGGLCARVLPGLPELILKHAVDPKTPPVLDAFGASGVMMIPIPRAGVYRGVSGISGDTVITAKEGQELIPLPEGSSYLGFIFAHGGTAAEVEQELRRIHSGLSFEISTALPVLT